MSGVTKATFGTALYLRAETLPRLASITVWFECPRERFDKGRQVGFSSSVSFSGRLSTTLLQRLSTYGDPRDFPEWTDGIPDYVAEFQLSCEHVPELLKLALLWAEDNYEPPDKSYYAPIHAWRASGQLRTIDAVQPLLAVQNALDSIHDDWCFEEFPWIYALIGPSAINYLEAYLSNADNREYSRVIVARALQFIAQRHAASRDTCVRILTDHLARRESGTYDLNGLVVSYLLELNAVSSAEVIERAYSSGVVDEGICGNWGCVR